MDKKEFARRRKRVMDEMDDRAIAILPTAPTSIRNRDVEFVFRPDSDFHYLTGFAEPEAVAVLAPGREQGEFVLFCRERHAEQEQWHGRRAGLEGACRDYAADDAFPIGDIDDILPGLMENRERVFYAMGCHANFDQKVIQWVNHLRARSRNGPTAPSEFVALDHLLHDLRVYKSKAEIKVMKKAMEISAKAHRRAMRECRPGLAEYQIEAELTHEFSRSGARSTAYPSIVAGGGNGCILHYTENDAVLKDGDLLLIDAGAELDFYASDITRTFPVNGTFTQAQRDVYEIVLESQLAAIEQTRPGNDWNAPHEAAVEVITRGLVDIGLLKGKVSTLIKKEAYKKFYMHRTGHWLGMDVHDVGDYKIDGEWRELEPGMVLTVEPGIYITGGNRRVPRKLWDIGIRIEDDVLVTDDEPQVLTAGAPKEIDEIEALMAS